MARNVPIFLVCVAVFSFVLTDEWFNLELNNYSKNCTPNVKQIQKEMFWRISLHTQGLWNVTPDYEIENIQFFPIIDLKIKVMQWIYVFHQKPIAAYSYDKNDFLEIPYTLAKIMRKLEASQRTRVTFKTGVYCKTDCSSDEYVDVIIQHFNGIRLSIPPNVPIENAWTRPLSEDRYRDAAHDWVKNNSIRRDTLAEYWMLGLEKYYVSTLAFCGCWDKPTYGDYYEDEFFISFDLRISYDDRFERQFHLRNSEKLFNFKRKAYLKLPAFGTNGFYGYFNDTRSGYEAFRLPLDQNEYAVGVALPHNNQTLKMFVNFTAQDHEQIIDRLENNYRNIDVWVPKLNLTMIEMNATFININTKKQAIFCRKFPRKIVTRDPNDIHIEVNRPYSIFIYHVKTRIVVWQGFIRDPENQQYRNRKFLSHKTLEAEKLDGSHIW